MARPRQYSQEFRERVIRMVAEGGDGSKRRIAQQLGISYETLRKWVHQAEIDGGLKPGTTSEQLEELRWLRKENAELRRANEILKSASAFFAPRARPTSAEMNAYIDSDEGKSFGVEPICPALGWNVSTYYAALTRPPSRRAIDDERFTREIERVYDDNFKVYGIRKVYRQLNRESVCIGRDRVRRLMRQAGLQGVKRGKVKRTTFGDDRAARPSDLVDRNFKAQRPNELWVADLTYVRTWSGFVYVSFVIDVFSRMIVGWSLTTHLRTDLPLDALEMAIWRRDRELDGLIHHSDAGSQFTSITYTERLADAGIEPSVGSRGDSYDNALAESEIGLFKTELIHRRGPWRTPEQVELATLEWVDWFNNRRLHGSIGDVPPAEFEESYYDAIDGQKQLTESL